MMKINRINDTVQITLPATTAWELLRFLECSDNFTHYTIDLAELTAKLINLYTPITTTTVLNHDDNKKI